MSHDVNQKQMMLKIVNVIMHVYILLLKQIPDAVKTHIRDTKVNDDSFPLVLSRRWKTVFIDSLVEFDRLQSNVIANQSIKDIRGITVLKQICRHALLHLQFSTSVQPWCDILSTQTKYATFQKSILRRITALLSVENLIVNTLVARLVCCNVKNIHDSGQGCVDHFTNDFEILFVHLLIFVNTINTNWS